MHLCIDRSPSRLMRMSTSMAVTGSNTEYTTASYNQCAKMAVFSRKQYQTAEGALRVEVAIHNMLKMSLSAGYATRVATLAPGIC
jgi:hypothetical protein